MTFRRVLPAAAILLVSFASTAVAQSDAPPAQEPRLSVDISGERLGELERWTKEYRAWKAWSERWQNRREPGWLPSSSRERKQPPAPPAWLPEVCALLGDEKGTLADGCTAWREWGRNDYAAEVVAQQITQTRADLEAPRRTIWWEHIHIDALWPMTQAGSRVYGVAGLHTTLQVTRRFQIFLAPGAMMMRLPTADGKERWSPATHWGFSYRLTDFRFPWTSRPTTLHMNIARVWVLGQSQLPTAGEMYLAGFSLTLKNRGDRSRPGHTDAPPSSVANETLRNGTPR